MARACRALEYHFSPVQDNQGARVKEGAVLPEKYGQPFLLLMEGRVGMGTEYMSVEEF